MTTQTKNITVAKSSESLVKYQSALDAISDAFFITYEEDKKSLEAYKEKMRSKFMRKTSDRAANSEAC